MVYRCSAASRRLEGDLSPQLQIAGRAAATGPHAKIRAGDIRIPTIQHVPIEYVERLKPKLKIYIFMELNVLVDRQILIAIGKSSDVCIAGTCAPVKIELRWVFERIAVKARL